MTTLNQFASKLFVVNLQRRTDRMEAFTADCAKHGIKDVERFDAHSGVMDNGKVSGHAGCVASHRGILELIAHNRWPVTMVFEDDAKIIVPDFQQKFSDAIADLPSDWGLAYCGGHWASDPLYRASKHWMRIDRMFTTSSYLIKYETARAIAPYISGVGPIDCLFSGFMQSSVVGYCMEPRLFIQAEGFSDIQEEHTKNEWCMTDGAHVARANAKSQKVLYK